MRCESLGESCVATSSKLAVPTCRRESLRLLLLKPNVKLKLCRKRKRVKLDKSEDLTIASCRKNEQKSASTQHIISQFKH